MSYKQYVPNERIVDRAVSLWVKMLGDPRYDNGDDSTASGFASIAARLIPKNNTPEILSSFGASLKSALSEKNNRGYFINSLHTDYAPDLTLAGAALAAGLDMEFPWKTNMWLDEEYVSVSAGYGAPTVYHYPLSNGQWLVTDLSGRNDIKKITDWIVEGRMPQWQVEAG